MKLSKMRIKVDKWKKRRAIICKKLKSKSIETEVKNSKIGLIIKYSVLKNWRHDKIKEETTKCQKYKTTKSKSAKCTYKLAVSTSNLTNNTKKTNKWFEFIFSSIRIDITSNGRATIFTPTFYKEHIILGVSYVMPRIEKSNVKNKCKNFSWSKFIV